MNTDSPGRWKPQTAVFRPVETAIANALLDFTERRHLNQSIMIDNKTYTLFHISQNSSAFFRSRGLSIYFKMARSIIRISDHWAETKGYEKTRKLNCGTISGKHWTLPHKAPILTFHR